MDEMRNILLKIYENQKRHEEEMAEMKKTLNEAKLEMSPLQQNERVSLRTTESCEEVLRTLVPGEMETLPSDDQTVVDSYTLEAVSEDGREESQLRDDHTLVDNLTLDNSSGDESCVACGYRLQKKVLESDSSLNNSQQESIGQWSVEQNIRLSSLTPEPNLPYLNSMSQDFPQTFTVTSPVPESSISANVLKLDFDFESDVKIERKDHQDDERNSTLHSLNETQNETIDMLQGMRSSLRALFQKMAEDKILMQQNSNDGKKMELEKALQETRDEQSQANKKNYLLVGVKMEELGNILLEMREDQKKQLEISRRQEEENSELKKSLNETKSDISLLKQIMRLSLRTTETCEEILRTMVPGVEHLGNRLQEVLDSNFGKDLSSKITETSNEIKKKVDEIQPALASFVIGQNGLRKQISSEFGKLEGLKKELTDTREELSNTMTRSTETIRISTVQAERKIEEIAEKIDQIKVDDILSAVQVVDSKVDNVESSIVGIKTTQNEIQRKIEESGKIQEEMRPVIEKIGKEQLKKEEEKKKAERLQAIQKRYNETVLPLLTGPLEQIKQKISLINGEIQISNGKKFSIRAFKEGIENNPWTIFPEAYGHILWAVEGITGANGKITTYNEVECSYCKKQVSISSCLREDKVSVECSCNQTTLLGNPKPGFQWVWFYPCKHFQKVPSDKTPTNCTFCGKQGSCHPGYNKYARTPTRKP